MFASTALLFVFLFQPDAVASMVESVGGGSGSTAPTGGCGEGDSLQLLMLAGMFAVVYFFLIRGTQKQAREREQMLAQLSKGTMVRTSGGIRGEIVALDKDEVTILAAPKVKLQVAKSNIAGVVGPEAEASSAESDGKSKESGAA